MKRALPAKAVAVAIVLIAEAATDLHAALSHFVDCRVVSYLYFPWAAPHNRSVVLRAA